MNSDGRRSSRQDTNGQADMEIGSMTIGEVVGSIESHQRIARSASTELLALEAAKSMLMLYPK